MKETDAMLGLMGVILLCSINSFAARPKLPKIDTVNFQPPKGSRHVLDNGLIIYVLKDNSLGIFHMTAATRTGSIYDAKEKIGLAEMTGWLLKNGGSAKYSSEEIDKTLEYLGASLETFMDREEARADMFCLKKDFEKAFDIFSDVLINPSFEDEKIKIKKDEMIEMIRRRNDKPDRQAVREAMRMFYGPDHPYGWRTEISTIEPVTKDDLKAFHRKYYKPNNTIIAVSGDFEDESRLIDTIKAKFLNWKKEPVEFPPVPPVKIPETRKIYLIDKQISQTFVVMLQKGIKRHDPVEFPLTVANEIFGGGIHSRLGNEIRSKRGLAYAVYSYYAKRPDYGFILGYLGTKPESTGQAISEMIMQFDLMKKEPVTGEELKRGKDAIINPFVFRFPTPFAIVSERALYEHYGYADDYLDSYVNNIANTSEKTILDATGKLFKPESALIFVIGDSKKFDKPLSEFGPVTELKED
ncbi:MAG: insulinase family protein [Elusimicrobia bacterium]|nr:insulinase family protein [Elusimicrobiota bacterium]